jgi:hypothetical protein
MSIARSSLTTPYSNLTPRAQRTESAGYQQSSYCYYAVLSTPAEHPLQLYRRICAQGFMAATKVKLAGKVRVTWARLVVTSLSSMGWRMIPSVGTVQFASLANALTLLSALEQRVRLNRGRQREAVGSLFPAASASRTMMLQATIETERIHECECEQE